MTRSWTDTTLNLSRNLSRTPQQGLRHVEPQPTRQQYRRHWGISPRTRFQLGQCDALVSAIRTTPVHPDDHRRLLDAALAKAAVATTAIEGGPLDETEVGALMAGRRLPPSRDPQATEVMNVVAATRTLLDELAAGTAAAVTPNLLLRIHGLVGADLGDRLDAEPGHFRTGAQAGRYTAPRASDVPELIAGVFEWLDREFPRSGPDGELSQAAVRALVTHVYVLWIRPFGDGNGRTARLLEAYLLAAAGTPAIASHLLTDFYNETRREYFRHLEQSSRDRSLTSFIAYAVEGLRDGLKRLHGAAGEASFAVAWHNFVRSRLADLDLRKRSVLERRTELMLAIPLEGSLDLDEVAVLDAETAQRYGGLSRRTLRRDLRFLVGTGLLTGAEEAFSANVGLLRPICVGAAQADTI